MVAIVLGPAIVVSASQAANVIAIISANYGCNVSAGINATSDVAGQCNGKTVCDYVISVWNLTDVQRRAAFDSFILERRLYHQEERTHRRV
jgi:hypothetical protein